MYLDTSVFLSDKSPSLRGVLTLIQGKRLFIKDITYYLCPPNGNPASIAPTCARKERGVGTPEQQKIGVEGNASAPYPYHTDVEPENPTVLPNAHLDQFHFTFLIRHPRRSIPSYYRCTVPPLDEDTGFYGFMPSEAGYDELRRVFDYLRSTDRIGAGEANRITNRNGTNGNAITNGNSGEGDGTNWYGTTAGHLSNGDGANGPGMMNGHCSKGCGTKGHDNSNERSGKVDICVVDADDLLDNPAGIIEAFCKSVGLEYDERMLKWDSEEDHQQAREAFEKWKGFHEDAIQSNDLKPRLHVSNAFAF